MGGGPERAPTERLATGMTVPLACLVFFAAWTLGLVAIGVGPWRVGNVLLRGVRPNSFSAANPEGPDWYLRLMRAHANCVENLPVFGALVLVGHLSGLQDGLFATLCQVFVAARVGQTFAHLASGRSLVVNIRFSFYLVQLVCAFWMIVLLWTAGRA